MRRLPTSAAAVLADPRRRRHAQILGTVALLRAFDLRDFAIGTVYAKTEVIIVALVSAVALSEPLLPLGWIGASSSACSASPGWRPTVRCARFAARPAIRRR